MHTHVMIRELNGHIHGLLGKNISGAAVHDRRKLRAQFKISADDRRFSAKIVSIALVEFEISSNLH